MKNNESYLLEKISFLEIENAKLKRDIDIRFNEIVKLTEFLENEKLKFDEFSCARFNELAALTAWLDDVSRKKSIFSHLRSIITSLKVKI